MIVASCHCGNVNINISTEVTSLTSCNCSICRRYGALWAYFSPQQVTINEIKLQSATYSWADKGINFHHCPTCGCLTHYTCTSLADSKRVAVNFRMVSPNIVDRLKIRHFDGADTWKFIDK